MNYLGSFYYFLQLRCLVKRTVAANDNLARYMIHIFVDMFQTVIGIRKLIIHRNNNRYHRFYAFLKYQNRVIFHFYNRRHIIFSPAVLFQPFFFIFYQIKMVLYSAYPFFFQYGKCMENPMPFYHS